MEKNFIEKFLERETLIPLLLIIACSVSFWLGKCTFDQWAWAVGTFTAASLGATVAKKRLIDLPIKRMETVENITNGKK